MAVKRLVTIREVLEGQDWLGSLIAGKSFAAVRVLLVASLGEPLDKDELGLFTRLTNRTEAPTAPVEEAWYIDGRRSGKSLGTACAAAYLAACCDYRSVLNRGERGILPVMAGSTQQAGQIMNFLKGIFTDIPKFAGMVWRRKATGFGGGSGMTSDRISLRNRVDIEVRPASFRTIRGITAVAAIAEEISTWQSDESLNPDSEILAAVRPALATTQGPLFCIGSPRAKRGETWKTFRRHFGPAGHPAILVANRPTQTFNPTIRQSVIDRAYEDDPQVAASEWGGKFRDDLESYVSPEQVDLCTDFNCTIRPYRGFHYVSHCDPSGGSQYSFCLAVGHIEGDKGILDCLVEHRPPFSPEVVISDVASVLHEYHLAMTTGDRYASGFNSELFAKYGIVYNYAHMTTSDFFGSFLPILNSPVRCRLLDNKRLASQLCQLERRPSRIGAKDAISHPPGAHDDAAACVAGLFVRMIGVRDFMPKRFFAPFVAERPRPTTPAEISSTPQELAASAIKPGIAHGEAYQYAHGGSGDAFNMQGPLLRRLGLVR